jgi:ABC-type Fe3+-hydroxamate transport system substrate-binding protein
MTETLIRIGAGPQLIGVSDYCSIPLELVRVRRLGTGLTPTYEALVSSGPTLVLAEDNAGTQRDALAALAPTVTLPWLAPDDIVESVRRLGELTGHGHSATELARRMESRLARRPGPLASRVLLVLGNATPQLDPIWFIRQNSLHGRALEASGVRNALSDAVAGPPMISLERLLTVNPDVIVVLSEQSSAAPLVTNLRGLSTLDASRRGRVVELRRSGIFSNGPRILEFVDDLERLWRELGVPT